MKINKSHTKVTSSSLFKKLLFINLFFFFCSFLKHFVVFRKRLHVRFRNVASLRDYEITLIPSDVCARLLHSLFRARRSFLRGELSVSLTFPRLFLSLVKRMGYPRWAFPTKRPPRERRKHVNVRCGSLSAARPWIPFDVG